MPVITIDLTAQQANRLQAAWTEQFGETPSIADVKAHLVRELRAIVVLGEKLAADKAAQAPVQFNPA